MARSRACEAGHGDKLRFSLEMGEKFMSNKLGRIKCPPGQTAHNLHRSNIYIHLSTGDPPKKKRLRTFFSLDSIVWGSQCLRLLTG